jgi:hypothetical protein
MDREQQQAGEVNGLTRRELMRDGAVTADPQLQPGHGVSATREDRPLDFSRVPRRTLETRR